MLPRGVLGSVRGIEPQAPRALTQNLAPPRITQSGDNRFDHFGSFHRVVPHSLILLGDEPRDSSPLLVRQRPLLNASQSSAHAQPVVGILPQRAHTRCELRRQLRLSRKPLPESVRNAWPVRGPEIDRRVSGAEALAIRFGRLRVGSVIRLHPSSLRSAKVIALPQIAKMLGMQMEMPEPLHAHDVVRPVVEAVEVTVMPNERAFHSRPKAPIGIETIGDVMDELPFACHGLANSQVVTRPRIHRRRIEMAR